MLLSLAGCPTQPEPGECSVDDMDEVYARYVEPIVTDAHPSSCNECHLAGVDLAMFVRDTPCASMQCMRDQELVDFNRPERSPVLAFVTQGEPASALMGDAIREREYNGLLEWIEWSSRCHESVCADVRECPTGGGPTTLPEDVATPLGGCDEDTLVDAFENKVWGWNGRCFGCHAVSGASRDDWESAPAFYGEGTDDRHSAMLTMYNLIGRETINLENPERSLLLTKPLAEDVAVDSQLGTSVGIAHAGGDKFERDENGEFTDQTFFDFADWVDLYASCR